MGVNKNAGLDFHSHANMYGIDNEESATAFQVSR